MALTRFNYQPGKYETCTDETLTPASPVLNTWYNFEIGDWKHAISDVVLKQGGVAIPTAAYELAIDTKYTTREAGESGKTVYAKWRIVNATYDEIATTVTGNNFGTYIDNAKLDSRLDALEDFTLDWKTTVLEAATSGNTQIIETTIPFANVKSVESYLLSGASINPIDINFWNYDGETNDQGAAYTNNTGNLKITLYLLAISTYCGIGSTSYRIIVRHI